MGDSRVYLSPPHMDGIEKEFMDEAYRSNWIAPLGPHVDGFELEFAERVGIPGAVALSSGTAAIHLALRLLDVGPGDTVFCSTLTFVASANPILYQNATPVFIDSDPENWNMSPGALERALRDAAARGTLPKAVVVVNLYGQSADMDPICDLCDRYGVPIVEDAAESLGATYGGRASGTFGTFGVYSFNGNKIITTSGGGMLVSSDLEALRKARFWATQARDPARHYQHSEIGYNYRLSNLLAAVGRGQLRVLDQRVGARRAVFDRYHSAMADWPGFRFMPEAGYGRANRWLTVLTVDPERSGVTSLDLMEALESQQIEARPVWKPLHSQPLFAHCLYYPHETDRTVSEGLFSRGICLPSGSSLTTRDQDRVIRCIGARLGEGHASRPDRVPTGAGSV